MMKKNNFLAGFLLALCISSISGQETQYDLAKCISTGLERNFSILIARNSQEISSNNFTPGNAGFLPSIDANSRYGGTINNSRQEFRDSSTGIVTSNGIHNTATSAEVSLGWPIFRGFNAVTNYKRLNELKSIGELNTQLAIEDFIAGISSEYYYLIQQIRLYENLAYAVSLSRERVRIDKERYLLGAASKLQLLQSQVYLNTDSSRYARQKEVVHTSQIRLNELMALENLGTDIVPADTIIVINEGMLYDSLLKATEELNTGLLIAHKNMKISEYDYRIVASRTYPYMNLSSGYSFNYNKFEAGTYRNQRSDGFNYGVSIGIPLFDGFNLNREKANAKIAIANEEIRYQQIHQQVNADLITVYYAYQNNLMLLKLEEENLKTAEENLEIALERYKLGSLSGLELREVQQSLLEAEERLLQVQYQAKIAEITLYQISGSISNYL